MESCVIFLWVISYESLTSNWFSLFHFTKCSSAKWSMTRFGQSKFSSIGFEKLKFYASISTGFDKSINCIWTNFSIIWCIWTNFLLISLSTISYGPWYGPYKVNHHDYMAYFIWPIYNGVYHRQNYWYCHKSIGNIIYVPYDIIWYHIVYTVWWL